MFDANAIRRRAKEIFSSHFSNGDRDAWQVPDDQDERDGLDELARHGLVIKRNGGYRLGERGVEVCMGELDLDVVLGLATAAPASSGSRVPPAGVSHVSPVSLTFVNNGQVGAMGPQASATATTFEQRSAPLDSVAASRIRHERDVATMRRAMSAIHLPSLDSHINRLPAYLTASGMWYFEQFAAVVVDGMFHLYDEELAREVGRLLRAWDAALSEDQHYQSSLSGHQYVFRNPGDMPLSGEPKRAWARIDAARREMADARDNILRRLRAEYLELDVTETSECALSGYCAVEAEIEAETANIKRPRR